MNLQVLADPPALAAQAALLVAQIAAAASGRIAVALSGGATPRATYRALAEKDLPWGRIHWFWGDERFVPPDDPQSNYRMARETLLERAPDAAIHPVATVGSSPDDAAERYERLLQAFYGADAIDPARPLFDIVLLGLGADGHTASLFPGSAVLDERVRWVRATENGRITLTYPVLASSRHTIFLVSGAEKRDALERLVARDTSIPAARVEGPEITVFTDRTAAG